MNEAKKKYELNYDRAVQDLYDIRDKAIEAGSFNAAISAQNSLLKVGGLIVDRKEVMFGKVDQMSREEVENRLKQLSRIIYIFEDEKLWILGSRKALDFGWMGWQ